MIILLLILIVLILLFGAGAVKGWFKGLALKLLGAAVLFAAFGTLTIAFGTAGAWRAFVGFNVALLAAKAALAVKQSLARQAVAVRRATSEEAWKRWKEAQRKPELQLSDYRPSRATRKQLKDRYLGR